MGKLMTTITEGWIGGLIAVAILFISPYAIKILGSTIGLVIKGNVYNLIYYGVIYLIGAFMFQFLKTRNV